MNLFGLLRRQSSSLLLSTFCESDSTFQTCRPGEYHGVSFILSSLFCQKMPILCQQGCWSNVIDTSLRHAQGHIFKLYTVEYNKKNRRLKMPLFRRAAETAVSQICVDSRVCGGFENKSENALPYNIVLVPRFEAKILFVFYLY